MLVNQWNKKACIAILLFITAAFVKADLDGLNKLLDKIVVNWSYEKASFLEVVKDIQKENGINIAVDAKVTNTLFRVKSNLTVDLTLQNVSLRNALNIFLDMFNLVYVYRNDAVFITYPNSDYTKKAPLIESYNIHELIPKIQAAFPDLREKAEMKSYVEKLRNSYRSTNSDELQNLIKGVVARETWKNEQNSISVLNNNMFISQQGVVHQEIKNILNTVSQKRSLIAIDLQVIEVQNKILQKEIRNFYSPQLTAKVIRSLIKKKNQGIKILSQSSAVEYTQQFVFLTDRNEANKKNPQTSCIIRPTLLSSDMVLVEFCSVVEQETDFQKSQATVYQNQATSFIVPLNIKVCVGISPFGETTSLMFVMRLSDIGRSKKEDVRDTIKPLPENFQKKLTLSYSDYPLTKVIAEIREKSGANIVVDPQIFTQIIGDEETLRVTFHVKSSTVENILNLLVSMTKLRIIRRENVLVITTASRYPLLPQLKFYNITDIIFAQKESIVNQSRKLMDVVEHSVPKESWQDNRFGIGVWQGNLIVRQKPENQKMIAQKIRFIQDLYQKNLQPVTVWAFLVRDKEIQPHSLSVMQGRNEEKLFLSSGAKLSDSTREVILEVTPLIKSNNKISLEILWRSQLGRYSQRSINIELENDTSVLVASIPSQNIQQQIFIGARIPIYPKIKGISKISLQRHPKIVSVNSNFSYKLKVQNVGDIVAKNTVAIVKLPSNFEHESGLNIFTVPVGDLESQESYILPLPMKAVRVGIAKVKVDIQSQGAETTKSVLKTKVAEYKVSASVKCRDISYIKRKVPIMIEVKNSGGLPLDDIRVRVKIPQEIDVVSAGNAALVGKSIIWSFPRLAVKGTQQLQIIVQSNEEHKECIIAEVVSKQTSIKTAQCCSEWRGFPAVQLEGKSSGYVVQKGERFRYDIILVNKGTAADRNIKVRLDCVDKLRPVSDPDNTSVKIVGKTVRYNNYLKLDAQDTVVFSVLLEAIQSGNAVLKASFSSNTITKPITEEDRINIFE
ncbi:hypothetical protein [Candidatus Uabimicrobium sp. HlEnr_7]|uniref:hypothetical protein n=1 Tax=Candidatus Uabimicrobium helgolandensis TaxID=3095367 RepID=UPI003557FEF4